MPTTRQIDAVHHLWNELTQFKAADSDAALEHLLRGIGQLIQADDAMWVGAVRLMRGPQARQDRQFGWRGRALRHLDPTAARLALSKVMTRWQDKPQPAATTIAIAAAAGKFRGVRLRELVNLKTFRNTPHYHAYYKTLRIADRMWISFPVNADVEAHYVFDRTAPHARFGVRELELAKFALRGLRWFHCQLLLSHGLLLADKPLSPAERRVLALLLTDASEKTIASQLRQSFHTTHTHVRNIYRSFGVTSRSGLMAIWLRVA